MNIDAINLKDIFNSLSIALDFTYSGLSGHHKRVAYMAVRLAKKMRLSDDVIKNLYISSIIHDIGAISLREKELLANLEVGDPYTHSETGCRMLNSIKLLEPVGFIIKCHHDSWKGNNPSGLTGNEIPLESRIINAVDRLDVLLDRNTYYVLEQSDVVLERLKGLSGRIIDPHIFAELRDIASSEGFWLDLDYEFLPELLDRQLAGYEFYIDSNLVSDISALFARVIDSKSRFTHRHSRMVAAVASELARISGFGPDDTQKMVVAGLLHDLGKLSVPDEILERPGKLNPAEYRIIKRHVYYTHRILDFISGFEEINRWASFHHEKLDGTGYPFRLSEDSIPTGSRIMAVSDVFAALAEDRPYRLGMPREKVVGILNNMTDGGLDRHLVKLLEENYGHFEALLLRQDPLAPE
ncbi:MAG: HD domain-containing phosphohydrolase [Bacillota bacterium]